MIDWTDPGFLMLAAGGLVFLGALFVRWRRKRGWALAQLAGRSLARRLSATSDERSTRWRTGLRFIALFSLALAAAGPRWGREVVRVSGQGSDLILLFDVSLSMDARDVPPSRLEEAKREAEVLVDGLAGDRVGVVVFAGDAAVLTPLTLDYSAVRILIRALDTGSVSRPGSDLGRGLRAALDLLPKSRPGEQAIVVLTDGEDLEQAGRAAGALVAHRGARVFAVGVGTPGGQAIPVRDEQGREIGLKHGPDGQLVLSRLDEGLLRELARRTHGAYFAASHPGGEVSRLRRAVARVERGRREGRLGTRPVERFALFAWIAWLAWVAALLLPARRRSSALEAARSAAPGAAAALAILLLAAVSPRPALAGALDDGNRAYQHGDFRGAAAAYRHGLERSPRDPKLLANLGSALYRLEDFAASEEALSQAATAATRLSPADRARILYNRGNALFRQKRYQEAAESYRGSLERAPDDPDARFNYEAALARLEHPPEPPSGAGGGGGGGGGGAAPPTPSAPPPAPAPQGRSQTARPSPSASQRRSARLSRQEAERILDALSQEEALAQDRRSRNRATTESQGRDW